ncbi:MAG TPA: biopolymer transporter ExbD [Myxococcales bacterium]|nr:biopolymer transporter ExbD [Myxococcales bacterium]
MAAKLGGGDDEVISEINVTPLVDIMLVLLIIFMLTSEAVSKKVVKPTIDVDLPTAASGEDKPGEPLSIVVNKQGALFLNGKEITEAKLREVVKARVVIKGKGKTEAVLSADKRLSHGRIVGIIDMLRVLGVENVAINTKAQEIE